MSGGIFLSIKDLYRLLGCENYKTAQSLHKSIRDSLRKKSKYVTIREYCQIEDLDFEYVWKFLRGDENEE